MQALRGPGGRARTLPGPGTLQVALQVFQGAGKFPAETGTTALAGPGPGLLQLLEHKVARGGKSSGPRPGQQAPHRVPRALNASSLFSENWRTSEEAGEHGWRKAERRSQGGASAHER